MIIVLICQYYINKINATEKSNDLRVSIIVLFMSYFTFVNAYINACHLLFIQLTMYYSMVSYRLLLPKAGPVE